ncbi:MAG: SLC13 family permease, partial [Pelagibacterales bacterium]|nr:SLC13 family permease [Pelagibacterales bacterium]
MIFTFEMFITLSIMIFAIIGYSSRKFPIDAVSISVLGLLFLIFEIHPVNGIKFDDFIAGFSNQGLLTVMALLVVAQGVYSTGILNTFVDNIMHLNRDLQTSKNTLLILLLLIVAIISSIMNNTPIIIIFIPLVSIIAEKMNLSISKALIPLSYAGILGGMTTLVGSSTNIIGAEVAKDLGVEGISFFSVTMPGLAIAIPGILFVLFVLPKLMPKRNNISSSLSNDQNRFIAQIEIDSESDLIGQTSLSGTFDALPDMKLLLIQRGEHSISAYQSTKIQKDDIIVVSAERKVIENALIKYGEQLHPTFSDTDEYNFANNDNHIHSGEQILAEVLISPSSRMTGRDLKESRFRKMTNCIVLGIKRSSRIYREQITDIVLEDGDVLLIQGSKNSIKNLKDYPDILLLDHTSSILPRKKYARRSLAIFLFTVMTIALGIIPSVAAAMIGASAMLASRVLSAERAINSLNRHIFLTIVS